MKTAVVIELTDNQLLEKARAGEREALGQLLARHERACFELALYLAGNESDAADACQDAFCRAVKDIGAVRKDHSFRSWLLRLVVCVHRNRVNSEKARRNRERSQIMEGSGESMNPASKAESLELQKHLNVALLKLEENYRLPITLHYRQGLSYAETAAVLDMPEGTVATNIRNGLESLRGLLAKAGFACAMPMLTTALPHAPQIAVPASLSAYAQTVATSTVVSGAKIGSATLVFKIAASVAVATTLSVGGYVGWKQFSPPTEPTAAMVAPVEKTDAEAPPPAPQPTPVVESAVATRKEKDLAGKEWTLTEWKEGERPYKKNLIEREKAYKEKWGEGWAGVPHKSQGGTYTMNPGAWKWEEFVIIPDSRKASPSVKGEMKRWAKSQANVFAPGGGAEVTVVWSVTNFGIYHVDVKTKQITFAGVLPNFEYEANPDKSLRVKLLDPIPEPCKDGLGDKARMQPSRTAYGNWLTTDQVTGRVYFEQKLTSGTLLRYVEELRPYTIGGKTMLLPALLDYKEMYKKVGAEPVMKDGKRAPAQIAVRTTPAKLGRGHLFNTRGWGQKVILSADGRLAYFGMKNGFEDIHAFEIDTGKDMGAIPAFAQNMPKGFISDAHEATSGNMDDMFYQCFHPGCGRGPGRLCSVSLKTGKITTLYDSLMAWPELEAGQKDMGKAGEARKRFGAVRTEMGTTGGPADAINLEFTTTCFQNQCPRTGSIIIGGWDCAGLWRYHDGFVTAIAETAQMHSADPRPEWKGQNVAGFGGLQSCPDVAPDGSIWLTDCDVSDQYFKGDKLRLEGTRIVKMWREDWPKEQPVNGYANQFVSPEKREEMMLGYCKNYIANYAELSKIY